MKLTAYVQLTGEGCTREEVVHRITSPSEFFFKIFPRAALGERIHIGFSELFRFFVFSNILLSSYTLTNTHGIEHVSLRGFRLLHKPDITYTQEEYSDFWMILQHVTM